MYVYVKASMLLLTYKVSVLIEYSTASFHGFGEY